MSAPSFTPGPWRLRTHSSRAKVYGPPDPIDGGNYAPICSVLNEANARLIAAAPELLEALKDMLEWNNCLNRPIPEDWSAQAKEVCGRALTAIAKATGREAPQ